MPYLPRSTQEAIKQDLEEKIVLIAGPRQVGKTTLAKNLGIEYSYLNYDSVSDRKDIIRQRWDRDAPMVIFDELHKMRKWKSWIKGVFDTEGVRPRILVTGSARLDTYRKGGDSLAGRHFLYRLMPLSIKETKEQFGVKESLRRLMAYGGFPEPFLKGNETFSKRWRKGLFSTVLREDLMDLSRVQDIKSVETLVELLRSRVSSLTSYQALANDLQVSVHTIKNWLRLLEDMYIIFAVRPYHHNVARSLLKAAKYYFYDTGAVIGDNGAKLENLVAVTLLTQLLKTEDIFGRKVGLYFLRDRQKHEVDFLYVVDEKPRQLVEVKWSQDSFDKNIFFFSKKFPGVDACQVVYELRRKKSKNGIRMIPAEEFLNSIDINF